MAMLTKNSTVFSRNFAALSGTRNDSTTSLHCVSSVSIAIITNMRPPPKAKPQDSYIRGQSISPSTSDNGDLRGISFSDIPGKFKDLPVKDSVSNILEPFRADYTLGLRQKFPDQRHSNSKHREAKSYLKARKDDVSAGVPGKFLHALVKMSQAIASAQDCSCCSLIAEKFFLTSPELLAGQGFSRLLLAGILMDTGYLTSPHCTTKDKYMARIQYEMSSEYFRVAIWQICRPSICSIFLLAFTLLPPKLQADRAGQ
ncbi:hypothetical protein OIU76_025805 [Salix suchowensis]|nr:hypothetical protein OIU76_025805 [Salix suchowensis]